jgi:hypothetical protein
MFLTLGIALPLVAQPPTAPPPAAQQPAPAAPAPQQSSPTATAGAGPASPVPSSESWLSGYLEASYRWRSDVGGSFETYRSIVNLGSGPKLIGTDFTILDRKKRFFDRVRVRGYDWDDPWARFHLFAEKQTLYEFNAEYRRLTYFNNLPSFADPLLSRGTTLNQQAFDTNRALSSFSLDLFPDRMIAPYLDYERDSSTGHGVTVFQTDGNQYPVPDTYSDRTSLFRGGVHFTRQQFHLTLEAGGNSFRNDQENYNSNPNIPNTGNVTTPVLGQVLTLSALSQAYGIRGNSVFTTGIITANPFTWLDVYGNFLYSQPHNDINYQQYNTGDFVLLSQALLFSSEAYLVAAAAKMPRTTGNLGAEIRPFERVRILESWTADRLHNAGSATQNDTLLSQGTPTNIVNMLASSLVSNYSQNETNVIYTLAPQITLRGGYRYVWGDANNLVLPPAGLPGVTHEQLHRNVGLVAVTWRSGRKYSAAGEFEYGSSDGVYFRTSLYNYQKGRVMGRYDALNSVHISGDYRVLSNSNPNLDGSYKYLQQQAAGTVSWNPAGKKYDAEATYEHCVINSRISYLAPQNLTSAESIYRENCNIVSALMSVGYKGSKLTAGGSATLEAGSRRSTYYQPIARVLVPFSKNVGWFAEWRYYGYGEDYYFYESFRAHLFTTGLRISR